MISEYYTIEIKTFDDKPIRDCWNNPEVLTRYQYLLKPLKLEQVEIRKWLFDMIEHKVTPDQIEIRYNWPSENPYGDESEILDVYDFWPEN